MITIDEQSDLQWYFDGSAEAAAGARSGQSGFEATMDRLALCSRARDAREAWVEGQPVWLEADQPAKESQATASRFDLDIHDSDTILDRLVDHVSERMGPSDALEKISRIYARLHKMDKRHIAVLERQYDAPPVTRVRGFSLSLLCATELVQEATDKVNRKAARKAADNDEDPPDPVGPREAVASLGVRDVLGKLSPQEQAAMQNMFRQAESMLTAAHNAYARTR